MKTDHRGHHWRGGGGGREEEEEEEAERGEGRAMWREWEGRKGGEGHLATDIIGV